jgi:hypothetical protein
MNNKEFRNYEINNLLDSTKNSVCFKIKLFSDNGNTKKMNISNIELTKIIKILGEIKENK